MKKSLLFAVLSFGFFLVACGNNKKKESLGDSPINHEVKVMNEANEQELMMAMLTEFYAEYIAAYEEQWPLELDDVNRVMKKYCTESFIKNLDCLSDPENCLWIDWDPFLDAQDFDWAVLQTLKIEEDGRTNIYKASYWRDNCCYIIRLLVVKTEGGYKIDAILRI